MSQFVHDSDNATTKAIAIPWVFSENSKAKKKLSFQKHFILSSANVFNSNKSQNCIITFPKMLVKNIIHLSKTDVKKKAQKLFENLNSIPV